MMHEAASDGRSEPGSRSQTSRDERRCKRGRSVNPRTFTVIGLTKSSATRRVRLKRVTRTFGCFALLAAHLPRAHGLGSPRRRAGPGRRERRLGRGGEAAGGAAGTSAGSGGIAGSGRHVVNAGGAAPLISGPPPAGGVIRDLSSGSGRTSPPSVKLFGARGSRRQVSATDEQSCSKARTIPGATLSNVSYSLAQSRSGTAAESRTWCSAARASVLAFTWTPLINHMTGRIVGSKGSNGTVSASTLPWRLRAARIFTRPPCAIMGSGLRARARFTCAFVD